MGNSGLLLVDGSIPKRKTRDGLPDGFECYGVCNDDSLGNVPRFAQPVPIERIRESSKLESISVWQRYDYDVQLDEHLHLPQGIDSALQHHTYLSRSRCWEASML